MALPIHPKILLNRSEAIKSGNSATSMDRSNRIGRFSKFEHGGSVLMGHHTGGHSAVVRSIHN